MILDKKFLDLMPVVVYFFPNGLLSWKKYWLLADSSTACLFSLPSIWSFICCISDRAAFPSSLNCYDRATFTSSLNCYDVIFKIT